MVNQELKLLKFQKDGPTSPEEWYERRKKGLDVTYVATPVQPAPSKEEMQVKRAVYHAHLERPAAGN